MDVMLYKCCRYTGIRKNVNSGEKTEIRGRSLHRLLLLLLFFCQMFLFAVTELSIFADVTVGCVCVLGYRTPPLWELPPLPRCRLLDLLSRRFYSLCVYKLHGPALLYTPFIYVMNLTILNNDQSAVEQRRR